MRKIMILLTAGALAVSAQACGPQSHYITASYIHAANNTVYIGYGESPSNTAHVMACTVQADNSTACRNQPAIGQLLNTHPQ
jgi:hypothetical protein